MKRIIVLGAGLVGGAIALDLKKGRDVVAADLSAESLRKLAESGVPTVQADLSDSRKLKELVKDFDLVIGALPGFLGFEALRACIGVGKNVVDISFFPEDAFELDDLARRNTSARWMERWST